jgi:hypothetical protein
VEIKTTPCGSFACFSRCTIAFIDISDWADYIGQRWLASYGDKVWRAIDAADPGAVPGGSTTSSGYISGKMTGPN